MDIDNFHFSFWTALVTILRLVTSLRANLIISNASFSGTDEYVFHQHFTLDDLLYSVWYNSIAHDTTPCGQAICKQTTLLRHNHPSIG
jgi:hypothetical protein